MHCASASGSAANATSTLCPVSPASQYQRGDATTQERSSSAAAPAEHIDDSVRAFMKLKELQPQQAALLAQLDKAGELSDDDQECLDFITDEIQRLMEELQEHGFSFPECASSCLYECTSWTVFALRELGVWPSLLRLLRRICTS